MFSLDEQNAQDWLRSQGWIDADERVEVVRLTGGVSNDVFRVNRMDADDYVLKQARAQLRVEERWMCSVERIWRERDVLVTLTSLLGRVDWGDRIACCVPQLLNQSEDDYVIAITAAPAGNVTWKEHLLDERIDVGVAEACGHLLAAIHAGAWGDEAIHDRFADRSFFDSLRIDPYYRHVARLRPELASSYEQLEQSLLENTHTLVHGDFSPKNLLVDARSIMLLDFEVGHFGDPAFDLGFFLTHLTLKTARANHLGQPDAAKRLEAAILAFCDAYSAGLQAEIGTDNEALWSRTHMNWAACCLARIDGKSPVDYLPESLTPKLRATFTDMFVASGPVASLKGVAERFVEAVCE